MRVLLVKTSSLGDILHVYPVVDYLHKKGAKIDWIVEEAAKELVTAHPYVNETYLVRTKKWRRSLFTKETRGEIKELRNKLKNQRYDLLLDLQGNVKSSLYASLVPCQRKVGFGSKSVPEWPNLLFTHQKFDPPPGLSRREEYLFLAQAALRDQEPYLESPIELACDESQLPDLLGPKKNILVAPGSAWKSKRLPFETLKELLQKINERYQPNFLFTYGSDEEKKLSEKLAQALNGNLVPKLPFPLLQRLMSRCNLVIAMDSLPLHLAGTTKTPTLSFFGPSAASSYKPLGSQHHAFQGSCPYKIKFERRCPHLRSCKDAPCLSSQKADPLFHRFEGLLHKLLT